MRFIWVFVLFIACFGLFLLYWLFSGDGKLPLSTNQLSTTLRGLVNILGLLCCALIIACIRRVFWSGVRFDAPIENALL